MNKKEVYSMATANINVRVDADLKKAAEDLFDDLGLNMSSAITMFLKCAVSKEAIPFEVKRYTPNPTTVKDKMVNDPETSKTYESFDEFVKEVLNKAERRS